MSANNAKNYLDWIPDEETANMRKFMEPLLTARAGTTNGADDTAFMRGAVLYSRMLTAIAGVQALAPILGPLTAFYKLVKDGKPLAALEHMRILEGALHGAVMQRMRELEDNAALTEKHMQVFLREHNIDPKTTPYA